MQDVSVLSLWRCLERRGGPDVYVTEYFRVHRDSHPSKIILRSITGLETEKPVIAQMIGNDPEHLVRSALEIQALSPCAGMDVNLGCPAPTVCGKQAGGALLKNPDLIRRIAEGLRPVVTGTLTLKTRIGFDTPEEFERLLAVFAELPIDALAIHGRTVKEKYQSDVHTDEIATAVASLPFPVIANGSIVSVETARAMREKTGAAGLMIGRGAIRNPWLFAQIRDSFSGAEVVPILHRDVYEYLLELTDEICSEGAFEQESRIVKRMKKFTNYIACGIAEGRLNHELRRATTLAGFREICRAYLDSEDPFSGDPGEDGSIFCGSRSLIAETAS
jgi:tRNA-dihydrouridine synthase